jgi:poly(hydroxyalkanoate) granule-associated protein
MAATIGEAADTHATSGGAEAASRLWLAVLGIWPTVTESGSRFVDTLVQNGEKLQAERRQHLAAVRDKAGTALGEARTRIESGVREIRGKVGGWTAKGEELIDEKVAMALHRYGLPTREEFDKLTARLNDVADRLETLAPGKERTAEEMNPPFDME